MCNCAIKEISVCVVCAKDNLEVKITRRENLFTASYAVNQSRIHSMFRKNAFVVCVYIQYCVLSAVRD